MVYNWYAIDNYESPCGLKGHVTRGEIVRDYATLRVWEDYQVVGLKPLKSTGRYGHSKGSWQCDMDIIVSK